MKRALVLALALACQTMTHAAGIPAHLTGIWATAESLYTGTTGQSALHLADDGLGVLVVSSAPAKRSAGAPDGDTPPRVVMALPARVTLEGDTVTVQVFMPDDKERPPPISCRYERAGPALTCGSSGNEPAIGMMTQRDTSLPADSQQMLANVRAWIAKTNATASAPRPAPATLP